MERINRRLLAACEEETGKALLEEVGAGSLLRRLGRLNVPRCCLPVLGNGGVVVSVEVAGQGLNDQDDLHTTEFDVMLFQISLVARA